MTDIRKAAEMALERLDFYLKQNNYAMDSEAIQALRQALSQPEQNELLKQGWRQCAIGQRTTQYCGMAEVARLEEREACLKEIAIELDDRNCGPDAHIALNNVDRAIRARR